MTRFEILKRVIILTTIEVLILSENETELPINWKDPFYPREQARILINTPAKEILDAWSNRADASFMLAAAMFSLRYNGLQEQADRILEAAAEKYPDTDFSHVEEEVEWAKRNSGVLEWEEIAESVSDKMIGYYEGGVAFVFR